MVAYQNKCWPPGSFSLYSNVPVIHFKVKASNLALLLTTSSTPKFPLFLGFPPQLLILFIIHMICSTCTLSLLSKMALALYSLLSFLSVLNSQEASGNFSLIYNKNLPPNYRVVILAVSLVLPLAYPQHTGSWGRYIWDPDQPGQKERDCELDSDYLQIYFLQSHSILDTSKTF